jgi:dolichol-phosphate mannosyltransferase
MNKDKLTVIVPCYNEETTLETCLDRLIKIQNDELALEIIIVDDYSTDKSLIVAEKLQTKHQEVSVFKHQKNQGKGAAIRTGIKHATGDFIAIQDADLEYNPQELLKLIAPIKSGEADVVFGSRFLTSQEHRVLYFWHSLGNKFLTLLSNMFTDLSLSDMETCYKVFRRDKIQDITIQEDRFGFEPEIVAKIAHKKLRIYEMGISYHGRTYEEGKKIGWKDGVRAFYCIFHYNAYKLPTIVQLLIYFFIGGFSAITNLLSFTILYYAGLHIIPAAIVSFCIAATVNYILCIKWLFRHQARWKALTEILFYIIFVTCIGISDVLITYSLYITFIHPVLAKTVACIIVFIINFLARKYFIFKEKATDKQK